MTYRDRTYCVRGEGCTCENKLTPEIERAAALAGMDLSVAYLCHTPNCDWQAAVNAAAGNFDAKPCVCDGGGR